MDMREKGADALYARMAYVSYLICTRTQMLHIGTIRCQVYFS